MIVKLLNPESIVRLYIRVTFVKFAQLLRLSNYILGARHAEEEKTPPEGFYQVPNVDNIQYIQGDQMMIPISQNEEVKGRLDRGEDDATRYWTKVYLPRQWKLRVLFSVLTYR
jgi:hypothetical protein